MVASTKFHRFTARGLISCVCLTPVMAAAAIDVASTFTIQCTSGALSPGLEADHSLPYIDEVMNEWSCTFTRSKSSRRVA